MDIDNGSLLAGLLKLEGYQQRTAHLFPGVQSIRWYVRQHRDRLSAAGAVLYIAGRLWIHPEKFDAFVLEAGARQRETTA